MEGAKLDVYASSREGGGEIESTYAAAYPRPE